MTIYKPTMVLRQFAKRAVAALILGAALFSFDMCVSKVRADAPRPEKKKDLSSLKSEIETQRAARQELESDLQDIGRQLSNVRENMIALGRKTQKQEQKLHDLKARMQELLIQEKALEEQLNKRRAEFSHLILALQRIRKVPPEALVLKPGTPLKTAQSALILGRTLPDVKKRAQSLKATIENLKQIRRNIADKRENQERIVKELKIQQSRLAGMVAHRQRLYARTQQDIDEREKRLAALSQEARSLKDLLTKIERKNKRARTREATASRLRSMDRGSGKSPSPAEPAPVLRSVVSFSKEVAANFLPVAGTIEVGYGQRNKFGATSDGIHIRSGKGNLVTTPMGGAVRYAGPFKNFGRLVIIEHKNNYHSLIAGLSRIDTVVGQNVMAGEPLGRTGSNRDDKFALLYYELRRSGKPVDPVKILSKLDS